MQRWALALDLSLEDSVDRLHLGQFDTPHLDVALLLCYFSSFFCFLSGPSILISIYVFIFSSADSNQLDIQVWRSRNARRSVKS